MTFTCSVGPQPSSLTLGTPVLCLLRISFFLFYSSYLLWLRWVFVAVRGLSLVVVSLLYSWWAWTTFCCHVWASHCNGFSYFGALARGARASVVAVLGLSSCGAWALLLPAVVSSQTRDRTCVPCIGRQILIVCTTREVLFFFFNSFLSFLASFLLSFCLHLFLNACSW